MSSSNLSSTEVAVYTVSPFEGKTSQHVDLRLYRSSSRLLVGSSWRYTHQYNNWRSKVTGCKAYKDTEVKQKYWWLILIPMILGELGNSFALAFCDISLVVPLRSTIAVGIVTVFIASFLLIAFSSPISIIASGESLFDCFFSTSSFVYMGVVTVGLGVLSLIYANSMWIHPVLVITLAAILGSLAVVFIKIVSSLLVLTLVGFNQLANGISYLAVFVLIVILTCQMKLFNKIVHLFQSPEIMFVNCVVFTIASSVGGICVYQELNQFSFIQVLVYMFGFALSLCGVYCTSIDGRHARRELVSSIKLQHSALLALMEKPTEVTPQPPDDTQHLYLNEFLT
ncbi:NIPA-like protein 2 [Corticium candelabrum]|uniref:NIPA-like protein 2 n=1 Tax=Corticium candelabrum TaxID=121492 RepID=UPI002E275FCF|nr:NIPA-like protein 2 [Corticium candelabrum]